jgi:uncharacterized protein
MRFVVLVILVVAAVWLIRRALRAAARKDAPKAKQSNEIGELVSCARCGMHLPRSEARESGGRLFCGEEHARLGAVEG